VGKRVRYEVLCGGRLLKEIEQLNATLGMHPEADGPAGGDFIDGQHRWIIDQSYVADDVAQALIASWEGIALIAANVEGGVTAEHLGASVTHLMDADACGMASVPASARVRVEVGGRTWPLRQVSAGFRGGCPVLLLRVLPTADEPFGGPEPGGG